VVEHVLIEYEATGPVNRGKRGEQGELVAKPGGEAFKLKRESQGVSQHSVSCGDEDESCLLHFKSPERTWRNAPRNLESSQAYAGARRIL
jgi:hypothetical protein